MQHDRPQRLLVASTRHGEALEFKFLYGTPLPIAIAIKAPSPLSPTYIPRALILSELLETTLQLAMGPRVLLSQHVAILTLVVLKELLLQHLAPLGVPAIVTEATHGAPELSLFLLLISLTVEIRVEQPPMHSCLPLGIVWNPVSVSPVVDPQPVLAGRGRVLTVSIVLATVVPALVS